MSKRLYFGNIKEVIEPPNLIEIQLQSYFDFLQQDTPAAARKNIGLQGVLKEIFPIKSYDENIELDFVSYDIEQPKMSDYEAIRAGETYSAALQVTFKLKSDNESKEETVYMGELPMMTNRGTFVINPEGRIVAYEVIEGSVGRNADELLRRVQACQFVAAHHGEVCPARWQPGEQTIKPGPDLVGRL